jgi:glycerol kinase
MQMQADVLGLPVERPTVLESTSLGAALLAGLATGFFPDQTAVEEARRVERVFEPRLAEKSRTRLLARWQTAVARSRGWTRQE